MGVDGGVSCCPGEAFPLFVGNVLAVGHHVSLCEAEVEDEELFLSAVDAHAEVIRFYIPMNEVSRMQVLYPQYHLIHQHQHCLQPKLPGVLPQQALQGGSHEIHNEVVVLVLGSAAVDSGDAVICSVDVSVKHVV